MNFLVVEICAFSLREPSATSGEICKPLATELAAHTHISTATRWNMMEDNENAIWIDGFFQLIKVRLRAKLMPVSLAPAHNKVTFPKKRKFK